LELLICCSKSQFDS
jgi:hypothetical protein